jgi:HNH endonuclease
LEEPLGERSRFPQFRAVESCIEALGVLFAAISSNEGDRLKSVVPSTKIIHEHATFAPRGLFSYARRVLRARCEINGGNLCGYWEPKKFNASLYDILMYTFAREDKNVIFQNLDSIREALIHLMTEDEAFINSIELSTSTVQAVTSRFDTWRLALQGIVGISKTEPRCFSRQLKEALFNCNSTCTICGQKIEEVDDAAVDHIKQYRTGGRTIPENARLTHRYCNWTRSRTD